MVAIIIAGYCRLGKATAKTASVEFHLFIFKAKSLQTAFDAAKPNQKHSAWCERLTDGCACTLGRSVSRVHERAFKRERRTRHGQKNACAAQTPSPQIWSDKKKAAGVIVTGHWRMHEQREQIFSCCEGYSMHEHHHHTHKHTWKCWLSSCLSFDYLSLSLSPSASCIRLFPSISHPFIGWLICWSWWNAA